MHEFIPEDFEEYEPTPLETFESKPHLSESTESIRVSLKPVLAPKKKPKPRKPKEYKPIEIPHYHHEKIQPTVLKPPSPYHPKVKHNMTKSKLDDHLSVPLTTRPKPKPPVQRHLNSKESHWIKQSSMDKYDAPVILGIPPKQCHDYFRAFTHSVTIKKDNNRLAQLLPHRYQRKVRVFGAPMVLLAPEKKVVRVNAKERAPKAGLEDEFNLSLGDDILETIPREDLELEFESQPVLQEFIPEEIHVM